jgi:hypothetical protein
VPIVFVHGVATRLEPKYWQDLEARKELIRAFLRAPLGLPETVEPRFAYWGGYGAEFRWGQASLPSNREEAFGETGDTLEEVLGEHSDLAETDADAFVTEVARRRSLEEAADLLFVAAAQQATSKQAKDLAELAVRLTRWMHGSQTPTWLSTATDDIDFITRLADEMPAGPQEEEAFGSMQRGWLLLRERLSRIRTAVPTATGRVTGGSLRPRLNDEFGTFIGDVLVYLERSGIQGAQSGILQAVAKEIEAAIRERTENDPLVVIAHSMGGNIIYDLLSYHRRDLRCLARLTLGAGSTSMTATTSSASQPGGFSTVSRTMNTRLAGARSKRTVATSRGRASMHGFPPV